jgi:hypothetical protein
MRCGFFVEATARTDRPALVRIAAGIFFCSEQDDRASGFAWYAREPELMCGAKGRASSQRSTDYHTGRPESQSQLPAKIADPKRDLPEPTRTLHLRLACSC